MGDPIATHPFSGGSAPTASIQVPVAAEPMATDFSRSAFTAVATGGLKISHDVFTRGALTRPPVIVLHEMSGLSWQCVRLARLIGDAGFRVYVPLLFGQPDVDGRSAARSILNMTRLCVSREIRLFAGGSTSPITSWLRELAKKVRGECSGRGVGVIGMCLTGGFALSLLLENLQSAPVVCQPALPFPPTAKNSLGYSPHDLGEMRNRASHDAIPIRAFRFANDRICPAQRLSRLETELPSLLRWDLAGDKHATLTTELTTGSESAAALEDVIQYFQERLA